MMFESLDGTAVMASDTGVVSTTVSVDVGDEQDLVLNDVFYPLCGDTVETCLIGLDYVCVIQPHTFTRRVVME